jgi:SAM-dependent methyltransferase
MKDIVENRKRISLSRKIKLAGLALRENGMWWCILLLTYYVSSNLAHRSFGLMDRVRRNRGIPGLNSAALNKEIWDAWDWSAEGDEWTVSEKWKKSLVRSVLQRQIPERSSILEIGPGGGRWTEYLLERAGEYVGIDISSACVTHCQSRFSNDLRARFAVGSGRDLAAAADLSIDAIWSFDVFVHINREEVEGYAQEFVRVLRPDGVAVIHHGSIGGAAGGWRSNLTAESLQDILRRNGLRSEGSFAQWEDDGVVHQLAYGDLITVIRKPVSVSAVSG